MSEKSNETSSTPQTMAGPQGDGNRVSQPAPGSFSKLVDEMGRRLPNGWERDLDVASGKFYYKDHNTQSTSWERPSYAPILPSTPLPIGSVSMGLQAGNLRTGQPPHSQTSSIYQPAGHLPQDQLYPGQLLTGQTPATRYSSGQLLPNQLPSTPTPITSFSAFSPFPTPTQNGYNSPYRELLPSRPLAPPEQPTSKARGHKLPIPKSSAAKLLQNDTLSNSIPPAQKQQLSEQSIPRSMSTTNPQYPAPAQQLLPHPVTTQALGNSTTRQYPLPQQLYTEPVQLHSLENTISQSYAKNYQAPPADDPYFAPLVEPAAPVTYEFKSAPVIQWDHVSMKISSDPLNISRSQFETFSAQRRGSSRENSNSLDSEQYSSGDGDDVEDSENDEAGFNSSEEDDSELEDFESNILEHVDSLAENLELGLGYRLPGQPRAPRSSIQGGKTRRHFNGRRGRIVGKRGPMRAAEPTGDIKLRLSLANQAFIDEDYEEADRVLREIIRINAETHEAWTLLSAIQREVGDMVASVASLTYASILRPKDEKGWLKTANYALSQTEGSRDAFLHNAQLCFASAIRANVSSIEGRLGRGDIKYERGNLAGAASDYSRVLQKYEPHNLRAVRGLGAAYFEMEEFQNAKELYKKEFDYIRSPENTTGHFFDWNDVAAYITVYERLEDYQTAILELRSLSRWLLGREEENLFDAILDNDCEWDLDDLRRVQVPGFVAERFSPETYGAGLPPEIRVKLGKYRLRLDQEEEAMNHLDYFCSGGKAELTFIVDYQDLYHDVAEFLMELGLYQNAITFFQQLKRVPELATPSLYMRMAKCFQSHGLDFKAEEYFQLAIKVDKDNTNARMALANMYERLGQKEQAFVYVNEVIAIKKKLQEIAAASTPPKRGKKRGVPREPSVEETEAILTFKKKQPTRYRERSSSAEQMKEEINRTTVIQTQREIVRVELEGMRAGDTDSTYKWMDAAKDMIDDFRGFKVFYPWDKIARFLGYTKYFREPQEAPVDPNLTAMATRLAQNIDGSVQEELKAQAAQVPSDYRDIPFAEWLDLFLEYALCLARQGRLEESYEVCEAAKDAIIWCHSREDMFLIHLAWCTCAVIGGDEEVTTTVARFFLKEYQFTTDAYRMFEAVSKMCHSPANFYCDSAIQKFMLRQVKAMDYALVAPEHRDLIGERGSYLAKDKDGRVIVNKDMDVALLMLYGHILSTSHSYAQSLNYYYRALTLNPTNPVIQLTIAITYTHEAIKRKAHNRQHFILQSLTFLFMYYETRKKSTKVEERQEAHYNVGRLYHLLGLIHLAIPYYSLVLEEAEQSIATESLREDLQVDAAYNLQTIYTTVGNTTLAQAVTEKWLIL